MGAYFHFYFHQTFLAFPISPVITSVANFACSQVQAIKIGMSTGIVPPSTFPILSAVTTIGSVVVIIERGELHRVVPSQ